MVSSSTGGAVMKRTPDHAQDFVASRSSTCDHEDGRASHDNGLNEIEESLKAQRDMQMLDLGTDRREWVTTVDKPLPRELRQSKEELLRIRKVNEPGTNAAKWYQQNKKALNAWNNISTKIEHDHADREQLADLMGGQSHRARLNREIKERGGQGYGEVSAPGIDDNSRRGRGDRVADQHMPGRSGNGAPTHVPNTMTSGRLPAAAIPSSPPASRADRPLDLAVDPHRKYGYKTKRGGKTLKIPYSGGQPSRVSCSAKANDARATMGSSTVPMGLVVSTKTQSEHSDPPRAPRPAPATVALNDQAFLRVMKASTGQPTFNNHVQEKFRLAPASKAAALVEQPAKIAKKPGAALAKSLETPAEAYRKLEARTSHGSPVADVEKIRLAPTHEFVLPPPITRASGKNIQGSNVSVHTDGVETAASFRSAEFLTQTSGSTGNSGNSKQRDDLIVLDQDTELPGTGTFCSNKDPSTTSDMHSGQSSGIPDIMDAELDVDVPQISLTPKPCVAPRSIIYRGARYVRADQFTSQGAETCLQTARPDMQVKTSDLSVLERVPGSNGLSVGFQTLPERLNDSVLGDHSLSNHAQRNTEASSNQVSATSKWTAEEATSAAPQTDQDKYSTLQPSTNPTDLQKPRRLDGSSFPDVERDETATTDVSVTSSAHQQAAPASNLAASKYATPNVNVMTTQLTLDKPAAAPLFAGSSATCRLQDNTYDPSSAPHSMQYDIMKNPATPNATSDVHPGFRSDLINGQAENINSTGDVCPVNATRQPQEVPSLAAFKWGCPDIRAKAAEPETKVGSAIEESCNLMAASDTVHIRDAEPKSKYHRQRNPFATVPSQSRSPRDDVSNIFSWTELAKPVDSPTTSEQSGNILAASNVALAMEEHKIPSLKTGSRAEPSMFKFSAAASTKPTMPLGSKWINDADHDRPNCSQIHQGKSRPTTNLMASKYASNVSHLSFRKVRLNQPDSESDESEI